MMIGLVARTSYQYSPRPWFVAFPSEIRGLRVADMQGVIGEVVSFLEPQAVLTYGMACKVAEEVLRQVGTAYSSSNNFTAVTLGLTAAKAARA